MLSNSKLTSEGEKRKPKICGAVGTNGFGFNIAGSSNLVIVVEAFTELADPVWSSLVTNTLTNGSSYFRDPQWTNYPARFYRLRSP